MSDKLFSSITIYQHVKINAPRIGRISVITATWLVKNCYKLVVAHQQAAVVP
jgi:hypothetical protein